MSNSGKDAVETRPRLKLKGVGVSPGIAIGKIFHYDPLLLRITSYAIPEEKVAEEIARFTEAVEKSKEQLQQLKQRISQVVDPYYAAIFDAHIHILQDPLLIDTTIEKIKKDKINAESVFLNSVDKIAQLFSKIEDDYLRARNVDIYDVANRLVRNLHKVEEHKLDLLKHEVVVVAHDLGPSDTAHMDRKKVIAFAIDKGGPTSHTAIMAKALEIPAVVGLDQITNFIRSGAEIIVDGSKGEVIINPTARDIQEYQEHRIALIDQERKVIELSHLPAQTLDGHSIEISANIELPQEIKHVKKYGAESIGLFRTEFIYLDRSALPSEEEQFTVYREVVSAVEPGQVIFRTLDLGGDKFASIIPTPKELNPFLGLRAIRLCLEYPEIFKTQLRAILRAGAFGNAKIMFPLVSCVAEVKRAKEILEETKQELRNDKQEFDPDISIGIMIEVPSAVFVADLLAEEVDFFSIGTNDLIQYTFAVDRVNEKVAYLYEPLHPAILRIIKQVIDVGHKHHIWVGLCGEMAAEPVLATLLMGMGIDELSMGAVAIPEVKRCIRSVKYDEVRRATELILSQDSAEEIKKIIQCDTCFPGQR